MLTFFSLPKPFRGHIAVIQRNAIRSWMLLHPTCEIILFGDEDGTREIAAEFGLRHVPKIVRNEYGTPLLDGMFEQAHHLASYNILCYVNTDIILMNDFIQALELVMKHHDRFLMAGRRWDADMKELLDFSPDWDTRLYTKVATHGKLIKFDAIDYFVFTRGVFRKIPPFAIGRTVWDNWLIYQARSQGVAVIDATQIVMAIHQKHDYSHIKGGECEAYEGQEANQNWQLAGGPQYAFDLRDATHRLTKGGIHQALEDFYLIQRLKRQTVLNHSTRILSILFRKALGRMSSFVKYLPRGRLRRLLYNWSK